MNIPFTVVGLIIGKGGENLRHIHDIFDVNIRVCIHSLLSYDH